MMLHFNHIECLLNFYSGVFFCGTQALIFVFQCTLVYGWLGARYLFLHSRLYWWPYGFLIILHYSYECPLWQVK